MADYRKGDRLRWRGTDYRVLGEEPGEGEGPCYLLQVEAIPGDPVRVPVKDFDALGDAARQILLRLHGGSTLTFRQTLGDCFFWLLDGKVLDDAGPRELQARDLIPARATAAGVPLTERGRAVAERLRREAEG